MVIRSNRRGRETARVACGCTRTKRPSCSDDRGRGGRARLQPAGAVGEPAGIRLTRAYAPHRGVARRRAPSYASGGCHGASANQSRVILKGMTGAACRRRDGGRTEGRQTERKRHDGPEPNRGACGSRHLLRGGHARVRCHSNGSLISCLNARWSRIGSRSESSFAFPRNSSDMSIARRRCSSASVVRPMRLSQQARL